MVQVIEDINDRLGSVCVPQEGKHQAGFYKMNRQQTFTRIIVLAPGRSFGDRLISNLKGGGQNNLFSGLINRGYNYIFLDCGPFSSVQNTQDISFEIKRANLTIAIGSTTPWRWKDFSPFAKDELDHWKIVIPGGLPEHNKDFAEIITEENFFIPLTNSPFTSSDQKDEVFEKLFNPVLPKRLKPKTSGGFSVLNFLKTLLFKNNIS